MAGSTYNAGGNIRQNRKSYYRFAVIGAAVKAIVTNGLAWRKLGGFSFILASLGVSLQVTGNYLYPIAVGVSVITTFTTPYIIRLAEPLYQFNERVLPKKWITNINRHSAGAQTIQDESDWKIVLQSYLYLIITNSVIIVALIFLSGIYLSPFIIR